MSSNRRDIFFFPTLRKSRLYEISDSRTNEVLLKFRAPFWFADLAKSITTNLHDRAFDKSL